jgi:hypothetical protein
MGSAVLMSFWTWSGWPAVVSIGTLALAAATGVLARISWGAVRQTKEQVKISGDELVEIKREVGVLETQAESLKEQADAVREQTRATEQQVAVSISTFEASLVPCVYPFTNDQWLNEGQRRGFEIPFRNGGPGVALNVFGHIYARGGHPNTPLIGTTLAGGDHGTVRLVNQVGQWDGAYGYVQYRDLLDREWETRFEFVTPFQGSPLTVEVRVYGLAEEVRSRGAYPAGWERAAPILPRYITGPAKD